ncbi:MAG TPA: hypothetical protein VFV87_11315 [Pirellulaceae bacterium]|nr:hypothetical protein [Pirellulaceae bacterium]
MPKFYCNDWADRTNPWAMTNPYQSPAFDPKQFQDSPFQAPVSANDYGWVSQVRIVAILNGVQGGLEIPMGLLYVGMAFFLPAMMQMGAANQPPGGSAPPKEFFWFMTGLYLVMGIPVLLAGILRILAAWNNFHFRGRTLGILSMVIGMASAFSCYCAPTGIALLVYGLVVYLNPAVRLAFDMGSQGLAASQILGSFVPYRGGPPAPAANGSPPQG